MSKKLGQLNAQSDIALDGDIANLVKDDFSVEKVGEIASLRGFDYQGTEVSVLNIGTKGGLLSVTTDASDDRSVIVETPDISSCQMTFRFEDGQISSINIPYFL